MLNFRDLVTGLRKLELDPDDPVIAHASLSAFGEIQGGSGVLLGALLTIANSLMMPAFTYRTMVTPEIGPENNAIRYGKEHALNRMAQIFEPDMPADPMMGVLSETLRTHPQSIRSLHPILSFTGINVNKALSAQTYSEPLAPIRVLVDSRGWVLLLGVDHTANTSLHYAERLAGRKQFVRWALTHHGIRACPGFPGCSGGFQVIATKLIPHSRKVWIGSALVEAVPLQLLIKTATDWILEEPLALLCPHNYCDFCTAVRGEANNYLAT
jgi:aminoglycoside 3-N-acetyltransferase